MRICVDLDATICYTKKSDEEYKDVLPIPDAIETLQQLKKDGHYIILFTSRNMTHYSGNVGKITRNQIPVIVSWLEKWGIDVDEIHLKPLADLYIDDKALKFKDNWKEIYELINNGEIT